MLSLANYDKALHLAFTRGNSNCTELDVRLHYYIIHPPRVQTSTGPDRRNIAFYGHTAWNSLSKTVSRSARQYSVSLLNTSGRRTAAEKLPFRT